MSVIMVPVANRPECVHALNVAFGLAVDLGGKVVGYHLHPHKNESTKIKSSKGQAKEACKLFDDVASQAGFVVKSKITTSMDPAAHWHEIVGTPDKVMPIIGPLSDMIVVSRPKGAAKGEQGKIARRFLIQALRASGRPTLILPQRRIKTLGKRVLIGWDQSNTSVQALIGALPVLRQAQEVVIHSAGANYQSAPKANHAKAYLAMHGIKSKVTKSKGVHVEQDLEDAYEANGSDLLVIGAYSRARIVERLLGGTSEHFIMKTSMPVLATHAAT